jgi:hypothetical protein
VSDPSDPTIRWQGTTTDSGLRPTAAPTARTDDGRPIRRARSPYEAVLPAGTFAIARQTLFWNAVPSGASARSKLSRFPAR